MKTSKPGLRLLALAAALCLPSGVVGAQEDARAERLKSRLKEALREQLDRFQAEMNARIKERVHEAFAGGGATAPAPTRKAGGGAAARGDAVNPLVEDLSAALQAGGKVPARLRQRLGKDQADRMEDMLAEFLGGGSLAEKLEGLVGESGGDVGNVFDEFLGDPDTLRGQIEEMLGPEALQGDMGKELDEALTEKNLPLTIKSILGGDKAPPSVQPYIKELEQRAAKLGGGGQPATPAPGAGKTGGGTATPAPKAGGTGAGAGVDLVEELSWSLNHAGEVRPAFRKALGDERIGPGGTGVD
ncbi:MAG: hypothetical protein HY719_11895, partial [Planctomycetes bacterium]|nr:hypothetical protein [Planctomycetota bacterium]